MQDKTKPPRKKKCPECHSDLEKGAHKMSCDYEYRMERERKRKMVNRIVIISRP